MATLVFGALGTLVGGPLGGAIGSLIGHEVDRQIIGSPIREGARLKELAVSSSSYGQPIARLFGTMRAAGTIIWATDLREASETASGGKGKPSITQYSYSVSLAVALSSRPILGIGRIWADGNLLRGEAGDLKTDGILRFHLGHADQPPDPLLAAALGPQCPAHRGLAYAVFEDLQLADFGNRIPALSFEVLADGAGAELPAALAAPTEAPLMTSAVQSAAPIAGFAHEGGSIADALALIGTVAPLVADTVEARLFIGPVARALDAATLPPTIAWPDGEFGVRTGSRAARDLVAGPNALRYYDSARDYQPGLQRAAGRAAAADERTLELPATLSASGADGLIDAMRLRSFAAADRAQLRVASLDPALAPGRLVTVAAQGLWRVEGWEWRSGGIELELVRSADDATAMARGDAGTPWRPADRLPASTKLEAFELPWDGAGTADVARLHVAVGAGAGRWAGAALYVERNGTLIPLGAAGPVRAVTAVLEKPLAGSPAVMFEPGASITLRCDDPDAGFLSTDGAALAAGANRLLVGEEIVQFMQAAPQGDGVWRLSGLLRGRGATEAEARSGHTAGACVVRLDERLVLLDGAALDAAHERIAAIGSAEAEPVFASVSAAGRSRRPLPPVHPAAHPRSDGSLVLEWTRRARGAWAWPDGVEVPLVEETEAYEVGAGMADSPSATWAVAEPTIALSAAELSALAAGTILWVRQIGSHAASPAIPLHTIT